MSPTLLKETERKETIHRKTYRLTERQADRIVKQEVLKHPITSTGLMLFIVMILPV